VQLDPAHASQPTAAHTPLPSVPSLVSCAIGNAHARWPGVVVARLTPPFSGRAADRTPLLPSTACHTTPPHHPSLPSAIKAARRRPPPSSFLRATPATPSPPRPRVHRRPSCHPSLTTRGDRKRTRWHAPRAVGRLAKGLSALGREAE
jgi:hypothetical protein